MSLNTTSVYGNVIDIRPAGKCRVIVVALANFKNKDAAPKYWQIFSFARQNEIVDVLQEKLDNRRKETGNAKAALTNVKFDTYIATQDDGSIQAQLSKVYFENTKSTKATPAKAAKKAPKAKKAVHKEVAEAPVAQDVAPVAVAQDDIPF